MRKIIAFIASLLVGVTTLAIAGCETELGGVTGGDIFAEACQKIAEAESITEKITLKNGNLTPYEYEKEYVADGDNYNVTETTTTYNSIVTGEEELKNVEVVETTVSRKADAVAKLNLDETLFESKEVSGTTLTATIAGANLKEVFGIEKDLKSPVTEAELKLELSASSLKTLTLTYASSPYDVTIQITFVY